ncbi:unnamed protein product [Effrenium voratum]|nr:unnamed protein product [Effrenium voratum]
MHLLFSHVDQGFDSLKGPSWRGSETVARKSIRDLENELSLDRDRLRLMIQQGVHKSKNGLKLTVRHVQPDIDREALWRYRRETLEKVDTHGKRIQQALNDSARARKDLQGCVEALKGTMGKEKEDGSRRTRKERRFGTGSLKNPVCAVSSYKRVFL